MNYRHAFTPSITPPPKTMQAVSFYHPAERTVLPPSAQNGPPRRPKTHIFTQTRRLERTSYFPSFKAIIFALLITAFAIIGWLKKEQGWISPQTGPGYWLGIVGGGLMLLLLVYPLRRRLHLMRHIGPVTFWFRLHLIAGIIGPMLIIYHANFAFGSISSTIALMAMLMVASSGLIGRYLYGKLYKGLHGQRVEVRDIINDASTFKRVFGADLQGMPQIASQMQKYELLQSKPVHGLASSLWAILLRRSQTKHAQSRLKRHARKIIAARASHCGWSRTEKRARIKYAQDYLGSYFSALDKASSYRIYLRMFSLWHTIHLPLFLFLIITVTIHIITAHS